ncbi:unnamed protein product [Arctia plantaginis]|uniref:Arrestin C-terminal-like domain-containing protein n=1 Tax=Arctia plantaginis TaxID=874455 RepID=A0A8S0ZQR2_ARCPL|nr:unnamed protein product [Arctia plantaginis]
MVIKCQILLRPTHNNIYTSGQMVPGTLRYSIDQPTIFKSITIFFTGKLKGKKTKEESRHLIKKEDLVFMHENVLQERHVYLNTGEYEHAFIFQLPEELPSTYRSKMCTISYKILVEFKRPGLFHSNRLVNIEIPVYGTVKPSLEHRTNFSLTKTPFLTKKNMHAEVKIEKVVFTAGDIIKLNFRINNETNFAINGIITKLMAVTTYKYDLKDKNVKRETINQSVLESPLEASKIEGELTCAVPTNLTNLYSIQHSKFFSREYIVNVIVDLPFPHKNISLEIPVVIEAEIDKLKIDVNCHYSIFNSISYLTYFLSRFPIARVTY